jgi:hypothetical protein
MAIGFLLILLAVVLLGGMFLGLWLSYRETEAQRTKVSAAAEAVRASSFYGWSQRDQALADDLMLRQIEHHLRRETLIAQQFIENPSPQTLRADGHVRLGVC